jgi:hypothetical protein
MNPGRSLAGFAGSHPHQGDQSEAVNTKPGCRAIIRCLKRYIAREIYRSLHADLADLTHP